MVNWNYQLPFSKIAELDDVMYIAGEASNPDKDEDDEVMDMDSLKSVFDSYMSNPVVKFMHDKAPQWRGAIGKVIKKYTDSDGTDHVTSFNDKPYLVVEIKKSIVPGWLWDGIKDGIYKGFSIGGKALKKVAGKIFVKSWLETSVVDVPSAHGAFFTVLKMACEGESCNLEKMKTPLNPKEPVEEIEPQRETIKNKKRHSWYAMEQIVKFKKDFPLVTIEDIQERFVWEEQYIEELLGKINSVSSKYVQKDSQISSFIKNINNYILDSFLKGGNGSGKKGHTTIKRDVPKITQINDKYLSMDIGEVRKKLLRYHSSGEILEIESRSGKNGEKALKGTLQARETGENVSFKKGQSIDNFLNEFL